MSKRKRDASDSLRKEDREHWTTVMDDALIDAFLHQHNMGNRVNGTFTTMAYDNIVKELNERLNKNMDKVKIKYRWKYLKTQFGKCFDLFKYGLSGFSWNSTTNMWNAEPEVWEKLIETHLHAEEWRNKSFPNYEKMCILYGKDRATGEYAETAKELRQRQSSTSQEELMNSIEGIDQMCAQDEISLENIDNTLINEVEVGEQLEMQFNATPSASKGKKAKVGKESREIQELRDMMETVSDALREGNEAMREGNVSFQSIARAIERLPIKEEEIFDMLVELGITQPNLMTAYLFLVKHPDELRAILGCPMHMRKEAVMQIVFGPSTPMG